MEGKGPRTCLALEGVLWKVWCAWGGCGRAGGKERGNGTTPVNSSSSLRPSWSLARYPCSEQRKYLQEMQASWARKKTRVYLRIWKAWDVACATMDVQNSGLPLSSGRTATVSSLHAQTHLSRLFRWHLHFSGLGSSLFPGFLSVMEKEVQN